MSRFAREGAVDESRPAANRDIAIVGGGAAGAAASLLRPRPDLDIAAIDPEPKVIA
jgi:spermidine synthase